MIKMMMMVKSVLEPSGPFSQSLSQFPLHEVTRRITTPSPGGNVSPSQGLPPAFHQASLTIF